MSAYFQQLYRFFRNSSWLLTAAMAVHIGVMRNASVTAANVWWSYSLLAFGCSNKINY